MNMFDGMLLYNNVVSWIIMLEIAMHGESRRNYSSLCVRKGLRDRFRILEHYWEDRLCSMMSRKQFFITIARSQSFHLGS
jgi:hypothetical protein